MKKIMIISLLVLNIHHLSPAQKHIIPPKKQKTTVFTIIKTANEYLAGYQESPTLKVLQQNENLLNAVKEKLSHILQSTLLDPDTKKLLSNATQEWRKQLQHNKDDMQKLKTIIYNAYLPYRHNELKQEKTRIKYLLAKPIAKNMLPYYEQDQKTLNAITIVSRKQTPKPNIPSQEKTLSSTTTNNKPMGQTKAMLAREAALASKFTPPVKQEKLLTNPFDPTMSPQTLPSLGAKQPMLYPKTTGAKKSHDEPPVKGPIDVAKKEEIHTIPSQASKAPEEEVPIPKQASGQTSSIASQQPKELPSPVMQPPTTFAPPKINEPLPQAAPIIQPEPETQPKHTQPPYLIQLISTGIQNLITTIGDLLDNAWSAMMRFFSGKTSQ